MKFFSSIPAVTICIFFSCLSSQSIASDSTPGANEFFQEFSTCETSSFEIIAKNRAAYEELGSFRSIIENGIWFDTKSTEEDLGEEIYRFEKPIKIYGLTAIAAGYSYPNDVGHGFSDNGSTYWGLYFSETPKEVFDGLYGNNTMVAGMRLMGNHYVNLKINKLEDYKFFEQVAIIEPDSTIEGVNSYFNCSLQY